MAETAAATLQSLDWRVKRLEHYLSPATAGAEAEDGDSTNGTSKSESVHFRLQNLERRLADIIRSNRNADALLHLRMVLDLETWRLCLKLTAIEADYPEIASNKQKDETLAAASAAKLPIVLASAAAYTDTVSRLNTLQQYPMADTKELVSLLSQRSRLEKFEAVQNEQLADIQDLQQRSIVLVAEWYQRHVLHSSEQWSSWEARMLEAEQTVRRRDAAKARDQDEY